MEWISVEERLPPRDINVILYDGNEVFCGNHYLGRNEAICFGNQSCDGPCYGGYEKNKITHWMPLPEPPSNDPENPQGYPAPIKPFEDK